MQNFLQQFLQQLLTTSVWEWLAVILALAYLLLAIKQNIFCWLAAFFSTAIYSVIFFDSKLYMESLLNIYYLLMAIYGFLQWKKPAQQQDTKPVISWSIKTHCYIIIIVSIYVALSGYLLQKYTDQDFAYLDSFTTCFAIVTTYMVAKKVLQNWLYWIVINSLSVYLFVSKGIALTALLFVLYSIIAIIGYFHWLTSFNNDTKSYAN